MKIAVIGSNGQLGSDICEYFSAKCEVVDLTHRDVEISNSGSIDKVLKDIRPQVVINTAAYHDVSKCEENPIRAFQVNGLGALNLAKISNDLDCKLVHYSTDYVFDGQKRLPYLETDLPNPLNMYAVTKLAGETLLKNNCAKHFIIRVSGIYGKVPCRAKGENFITTMVKLSKEKPLVKVVNDEILTPTATHRIAKNTYSLMQTDAFGVYHMTCQGECSWYEFAKVIFETLNLKTPLEPCSVVDFPLTVRRPNYSVLKNHNLQKIDQDFMNHWKEALIEFLKQRY